MKIYPLPLLLLLVFLACSESPLPTTGDLYYDSLGKLYDEHDYFVWVPSRFPRPGYNKNTYLFPFEPLNLRVALDAPDDESHIIGWRLDKSKAWLSGEYKDFYILDVEYHCGSEYIKVKANWGHYTLDRHIGSATHTHNCDYTGYD